MERESMKGNAHSMTPSQRVIQPPPAFLSFIYICETVDVEYLLYSLSCQNTTQSPKIQSIEMTESNMKFCSSFPIGCMLLFFVIFLKSGRIFLFTPFTFILHGNSPVQKRR